ncbi:hypothetical protein [Lysinibacillus sp. NPDC092081]
MKTMELCVEETEVIGDYGFALQAFIINPLIGNISNQSPEEKVDYNNMML